MPRNPLPGLAERIGAPTLLSRPQAAEFLGCSEWSLHQYIHRGRDENPLPVRKVGRLDRFLVDELLEWTEEEERRSERAQARRKSRTRASKAKAEGGAR